MNSSPNLGAVIESPRARKIIYGVYILIVFVIGCAQVAYASLELGQPAWLTAAIAVAAYAGIPVGGLAAVNTSTTPADDTGDKLPADLH